MEVLETDTNDEKHINTIKNANQGQLLQQGTDEQRLDANDELGKAADGKNDKQQKNSTTQQSSSKLESLSRDDLIKLIRKQLLNQKETKKQLEFARKEAEDNAALAKELSEKLDNQKSEKANVDISGIEGESLLAIELADYKKAISVARKELQESKDTLVQKEALVQELFERIATLQEEKEEINVELKNQHEQSNELRRQIEEKSFVITEKSQMIAENSKEIDALLAQLYESRQSMQDEISTLQKQISTQAQQLVVDQRADEAKNVELRRLRCENETLTQRIMNMEKEFINYKQQAEYALKAKMNSNKPVESAMPEDNSDTTSNKNGMKHVSSEVDQLLDLLRQKNTEISQLNVKCSFLEEEVRGGQEHARTLLNELDALHASIVEIRRQNQADRQQINQEWEQRIKDELALKRELERELRMSREREKSALELSKQTELKLTLECERMGKELDEAKNKISVLLHEATTRDSPINRPVDMHYHQQRSQNSKLAVINRPCKLRLTPLNISLRGTSASMNLSVDNGEEEHDQEDGLNSESSDSLDDLQSVLQQAEHAPTSEAPSLNVATALSAPDEELINSSFSTAGDEQQLLTICEQLRKQLADCRDLLGEAEETNVHYMEQINVLKEEIRRLERSQKRVEQLGNGVCSEYFKNIVLKFLAPPRVHDERTQLLPVLQTILHLDEHELEQVRLSCAAADAATAFADENNQTGNGANTSGASFADWSSWVGWK